MCLVEIDGWGGLSASCVTPASDGLVIHTESQKVIESRKNTLELLMASGNHNCAIGTPGQSNWEEFQENAHEYDKGANLCPAWGDCTLQDYAYRYQIKGDKFAKSKCPYPLEDTNPFITRDFSRCILCGRCVQACNEIQVNRALSIGLRGSDAKVITGADTTLADSNCVFCGECIQVCPVGALVEKDVIKIKDHWINDKIRTTCSYCGVGCQMYLHVKENKVIKVTGVEDAAPNYGSLCVKGRYGFDFIHSPERLTKPLIKKDGEFVESSWDEALDLVANKFNEIKDAHGSDSLGVFTSARMSNEENYIAHKFTRAVLKTNNIDHCARL
jgi:predicted molibdopterin-dependent oxidoreductase YjgC